MIAQVSRETSPCISILCTTPLTFPIHFLNSLFLINKNLLVKRVKGKREKAPSEISSDLPRPLLPTLNHE